MTSIEAGSTESVTSGARGTPPVSSGQAGSWLAAIFKSSRDAVFGTDVNGSVTCWNTAAEAMFGLKADEMIGRSIRAIIPADRIDEETSILDRILSGDAVGDFETVRRHENGTVFPVSLTVSAIHDGQCGIIGVCEIARDLSEMQSVRRELEQREALLRQAHKMAAIGRLATGAAHDFNNVLQSVVNALELVLDDVAEDTQARQFTEIAINAAIRGASLTGHMLSIAREQVPQPKIIDLGAFLYDIRELLARTLGPHIDVAIRLDGSPTALADPGQLQTAMLNLAINASNAMPRGGSLTMAAGMESENGEPRAVICFTDTGVGKDNELSARPAVPLFTTKGGDGGGLGLSMVQGFAERSGGALRITSAPGQGNSVRLTMPSTMPTRQVERRKTSLEPLSHRRILLVDDLTDVLLTLTALLAKAGFKVTPADSGIQALAILEADGPFDVLITDFAMPGMNGADLITRCRIVQPGLRAVVITGFNESNFADTLPKGTDVLYKPVQRQDLIEMVHRILRRDQEDWLVPFNGPTGGGHGVVGEPEQSPGSRPFGQPLNAVGSRVGDAND